MFAMLSSVCHRYIVLILLGIFSLRVSFLFINGLDLIGDESYYWDWSRRLDWCYYSKPPMVAWLIALSTSWAGDNVVAVRLPAAILGTLSLAYVYAAALFLYGQRAALVALLLLLATPFSVLAHFIMTIDPPLYCFWSMTLYYLSKALFGKPALNHWFYAGLSTACALLSKQVALLLPLMLLIFLLCDGQRRVLLKREFLLYCLPILLALVPLLIWNQQHDWIMLGHSQGHFGIKPALTIRQRLWDAGSLYGYQLLLVSPVLLILVLTMSFKMLRNYQRLSPDSQFLLLMGPVLLLGILLLGMVQKVQGNWPLPFYGSALILLSGQVRLGLFIKPVKIALIVGFLMTTLTYALPTVITVTQLQNTPLDPLQRFRHWHELAKSIEKIAPQPALVLTIGHRFLASELAFYLTTQPLVYRYESSGQVVSQYELWPNPQNDLNQSVIIVSEQSENLPLPVQAAFQHLERLDDITHPIDKPKQVYVYRAEGIRYWPKAHPFSEIK